jgi:hypothetical protein
LEQELKLRFSGCRRGCGFWFYWQFLLDGFQIFSHRIDQALSLILVLV